MTERTPVAARRVAIALVFCGFLAVRESSGNSVLQNMTFDTDLSGWTVGAVEAEGVWSVVWSDEHGGSAKMYISGAPGATDISQKTLTVIEPGDRLGINLYHTATGNFGHWVLEVGGDDNEVLSTTLTSEGYESLTWTADKTYEAGTLVSVRCAVWPGVSTTWVDGLEFTPASTSTSPVPEPLTMLTLTLGVGSLGAYVRRRLKRKQ